MDSTATVKRLGVIGLSHLGIIWSAGYASLGFNVVGFDTDTLAVDDLTRGKLPVPEPGLPELLEKSGPLFTFSDQPTSLRACDVVFFARDVPMDEAGRIDLTPINQLLAVAIPHLAPQVEFIFIGQVPVGFTRTLSERITRMRPAFPFTLTYRVETVTIGQAVNDFLHPDRVILGVSHPSERPSPKALAVLQQPFSCPITVGSYESAELTKSAINVYLGNAVAFVNTIADLCEKVGANIEEVVRAMKMDKRFSPLCYWRPGLGFAGGHIERDLMSLTTLAEKHGLKPHLFNMIIENSHQRYQWLVQALDRYAFQAVPKPTLCLWGLAYKKGTASLHNAHCLKIFRDYGARAEIRAYDPIAKLPKTMSGVQVFPDKFLALDGSDALIILTEWDEFRCADPRPFLERMQRPVIIDGVHILEAAVREAPGITYVAMGIPVKKQP